MPPPTKKPPPSTQLIPPSESDSDADTTPSSTPQDSDPEAGVDAPLTVTDQKQEPQKDGEEKKKKKRKKKKNVDEEKFIGERSKKGHGRSKQRRKQATSSDTNTTSSDSDSDSDSHHHRHRRQPRKDQSNGCCAWCAYGVGCVTLVILGGLLMLAFLVYLFMSGIKGLFSDINSNSTSTTANEQGMITASVDDSGGASGTLVYNQNAIVHLPTTSRPTPPLVATKSLRPSKRNWDSVIEGDSNCAAVCDYFDDIQLACRTLGDYTSGPFSECFCQSTVISAWNSCYGCLKVSSIPGIGSVHQRYDKLCPFEITSAPGGSTSGYTSF